MWSQYFVAKLILEKNLRDTWKQYRIPKSDWVYYRINEQIHKTHHAVKVEDILRKKIVVIFFWLSFNYQKVHVSEDNIITEVIIILAPFFSPLF